MKKLQFFLVLFVLTSSLAFSGVLEKHDELRNTIQDIRCINLIVGLNLTQDQLKSLLDINRDIERLVTGKEARMDELIQTYEKFRSALITDGFNLDKELMKKTGKLHRAEKNFRELMKETVKKSFKQAEGLLTEAQKKVLENYRPCLIPTRDLRNPSRIGQAARGGRFIKILRRARNVPDDKLEEVLARLWSKAEKKVRRKLRDEEKIQKYKNELIEVVAEARNMSDAEFELNNEELVKRLVPEKPQKKNRDNKRVGKLRFLVRPGLSSIYQEMLSK